MLHLIISSSTHIGITACDSKVGEKIFRTIGNGAMSWDKMVAGSTWKRGNIKLRRACVTYKVQEAAPNFVMSVGLRLEQLFHHGQEVFVNGQNLLDVGEQNLREQGHKDTGLSNKSKCVCSFVPAVYSSNGLPKIAQINNLAYGAFLWPVALGEWISEATEWRLWLLCNGHLGLRCV